MAKCKICEKIIPDETEYCKECLDKEKTKDNESYLDSLLNTVKNTAPTTDSVNKKKSISAADIAEPYDNMASEQESNYDEIFDVDLSDIEDYDKLNINDDLDNLDSDDISDEISDEDLFGQEFMNFFSDEDESKDESKVELKDRTSDLSIDLDNAHKKEMNEESLDDENSNNDSLTDIINSEHFEEIENNEANAEPEDEILESDMSEYVPNDTDNNMINKKDNEDFNDDNGYDTDINDIGYDTEFNNDDGYDTDINDLLGQLEYTEDNDDTQDGNTSIKADEYNETEEMYNEIPEDNIQDISAEDDDFLSLLNQISSDDPVADDVKAINDLMNGVVSDPLNDSNMPSDVGEVFSDALKAVSNLNDPNLNESEIMDQIDEIKGKKKKKEKKKKDKKKKGNKSDNNQEDGNADEKPQKGLFQRLFGNVEDKNTPKKVSSIDKSNDGENANVVELAPKVKPKKGKKNKKGKDSADANGAEASETKKAKKKPKKEKKPKKQKSDDVIQVIDELDEDVGRINRLGAAIVFVFFALIALLIYAGSNAVSYTLGIQHATKYFHEREYTQAYEEVDGMKIKDEDLEIYNKILTVMFVNKQLNSYNNYRTFKDYPRALDSLLKGLKRYDKYIEQATIFGIKSDMNYVRRQILAELKHQFGLSEEAAYNIINLDNMEDYSSKVYEVSSKNE